MAEATATQTPKAKAKPASSMFETPKFEMPNFEFPKIDMPAAFREFSEKSAATAKEAYDKMKSAAEESTAVLEETYATTSKGVTAFHLKLIECARANANAAFDFAGAFISAKTPAEALELSSTHARKQFEAMTTQGKELTSLAQKTATEAAEPIKASVNNAFSKVA